MSILSQIAAFFGTGRWRALSALLVPILVAGAGLTVVSCSGIVEPPPPERPMMRGFGGPAAPGFGRMARGGNFMGGGAGGGGFAGPMGANMASLDASTLNRIDRIERALLVDGVPRNYTVYMPDDMSSRRDVPVIIAYHPALGSAAFMEQTTRIHDTPGAEGFMVVYPEGVRRTWNAGECCGLANRQNVDDIGFFDAMMADLGTIADIRPEAYVTGFSNGALMVYQLMCRRPNRVAAAAAFAAYLPPDTLARCPRGRVPLLHIHGDADRGAPVEGGTTNYLGVLPPARQSVEAIARRNGCSLAAPRNVSVPELKTTCVQYSGCASDARAQLCVIPDLGHVWPGMASRGGRFGPARPDVDGSRAIVEFFLEN